MMICACLIFLICAPRYAIFAYFRAPRHFSAALSSSSLYFFFFCWDDMPAARRIKIYMILSRARILILYYIRVIDKRRSRDKIKRYTFACAPCAPFIYAFYFHFEWKRKICRCAAVIFAAMRFSYVTARHMIYDAAATFPERLTAYIFWGGDIFCALYSQAMPPWGGSARFRRGCPNDVSYDEEKIFWYTPPRYSSDTLFITRSARKIYFLCFTAIYRHFRRFFIYDDILRLRCFIMIRGFFWFLYLHIYYMR